MQARIDEAFSCNDWKMVFPPRLVQWCREGGGEEEGEAEVVSPEVVKRPPLDLDLLQLSSSSSSSSTMSPSAIDSPLPPVSAGPSPSRPKPVVPPSLNLDMLDEDEDDLDDGLLAAVDAAESQVAHQVNEFVDDDLIAAFNDDDFWMDDDLLDSIDQVERAAAEPKPEEIPEAKPPPPFAPLPVVTTEPVARSLSLKVKPRQGGSIDVAPRGLLQHGQGVPVQGAEESAGPLNESPSPLKKRLSHAKLASSSPDVPRTKTRAPIFSSSSSPIPVNKLKTSNKSSKPPPPKRKSFLDDEAGSEEDGEEDEDDEEDEDEGDGDGYGDFLFIYLFCNLLIPFLLP